MDTVSIMRINRNLLDVRGYALPQDYSLSIDRIWLYPDGTPEPRRVTVLYSDNDGDGLPDVPDLYFKIVSPTVADTYLFWSNLNNQPYEVPIYNVKVYDTYALRALDRPAIGTIGFQVTGDTYLTDETFHIFTSQGWVMDTTNSFRCRIGRGPNTAAMWMTATGALTPVSDQLAFKWQHYAPSDHRIDPAQTNIVDIFVLTAAYDATVRLWIANGADPAQRPQPPSELDLRLAFSALEDFKMFSDTVVWRPVQYRFLFGNGADDELRAQFKVVRLPNAAVSDGEIKTRIINAINSYFAVSNWDFGDTFYFTELAAYIHQQLVGLIGSIVLVPLASEAAFGDGFEISCRADEIFISTAQVSDIVMIGSNTAINLRIN
jgi:hypothetical protein